MQHKWHKEIKAWADGAEIEFLVRGNVWRLVEGYIMWDSENEYRIKPQPKEPQYLYVYKGDDGKPELSFIDHQESIGKIKLEVDDD